MPEVREVNFLKLSDCAPCNLLEGVIDKIASETHLKVKKIMAKPVIGREAYVLVCDEERQEVEASSLVGFPSVWLTFTDGTHSKMITGVLGPNEEDPLSHLLRGISVSPV